LNTTTNRKLNRKLKEYTIHSMSYEVSILWFKAAPRAAVHWSIFIQAVSTGNSVGTKHDCMFQGQPGRGFRWTYSFLQNYHAYQSAHLGGKVVLGYINDLTGFGKIMRETALPVLRENCQSWVWKVIREAVRQCIIDASAVDILATVRTTGTGI
jgi:hypothetical protein